MRTEKNNLMLSLGQDILILVAAMIATLAFIVAVNRLWPCSQRREHNDLTGWQLSVIGTTYAVILGFMLYAVWNSFGEATLNADLEANALRNVYRLAEGLPQQQRNELRSQTRAYADDVLRYDWPEMAEGNVPEESHHVNEAMWKTLMSVKDASPTEAVAEDHAISELSTLTEHRRTRLLQSTTHLPAIFWCVLIIGAILTIAASTMFGSANPTLHSMHIFSLSLLITLVLLAISDVNLPFRGWVHVSDYAFVRAQLYMRN